MAEQQHKTQQAGDGPVGAQNCNYSLEAIMKLQKALENGIPSRSPDTDIAEDPMDGSIRREPQHGQANSEDDGADPLFSCLWIQRPPHLVREAIRHLLADFRTRRERSDVATHAAKLSTSGLSRSNYY
jgi:hypothetical protein